ncbi:MAG: 50S ribosomal protein L1 [Candidatus Nomurabacteria bacterium]|nr:50S ribosomal protein L1 [Candidatus Nomurabacteria bacterium]
MRPRAERKGKNYRKLAAKIEKGKVYTLKDAVQLAVDTANTKFDSSVEIHVRLGVDPKHADQNIRATVALPNGTGKTVRVAAFVPEADAAEAKTAGADIAGEETILQALDKEVIDFEVLVATPQLMPKLGKYARLLGPRGLMPNPKSGTVSTNPTAAIKEAKGGKVEYRVDKQSIVHLGIGKVSFGADKLLQNATGFLASLNSNKPASLKGIFILSTYITTTMGPSIKVSL